MPAETCILLKLWSHQLHLLCSSSNETLHIGAETEQVQLMALTAILPARVKLLSTAERSVHMAQRVLGLYYI